MDIIFLIYISLVLYACKFVYPLFWKPLNYNWKNENKSKPMKSSLKGSKNVYPNGWYVLLESRSITKNQCFDTQCCGLDLVVWRGSSLNVYVGDAFCPHLGAHLGIGGVVREECVQCPFHGWEFSGNSGKCVSIPYTDTIPTGASIKMYPILERNGFIYFWHHALAESPNWFPNEYKEITRGEFTYRGRAVINVNSNLQDIAENFGDTSHLATVHNPSYLRGSSLKGFNWYDKVITGKWEGEFFISTVETEKHEGNLVLKVEQVLFGVSLIRTIVYGKIEGPALTSYQYDVPGGKAIHFFHATPKSCQNDIKIISTCYMSKNLPMFLSKLYFYSEVVQIARDAVIWDRKKHLRCDILAKKDNNLKTFKKWYKQFYSKSSPSIEF